MFINDEKFFRFLIDHKLTANQFVFCYMLCTIDRNHKFLNKYVKEVAGIVTPEDIDDLEEREYIGNMNTPGEYFHDLIMVRDKFKEAIIVDSEDAFEEIWKAYPVRLQQAVQGGGYPMAKTSAIGKEGLQKKYVKYISNDVQKHLRVMEVLLWFKERSKITVGIEKFILNQLWEDWATEMEGLRDNGTGNEYGISVK